MTRTRHYAVHDCPVILLPLPGGGLEARSMDPVTGLMVPDPGAFPRISEAGGTDVEALTPDTFQTRLDAARAMAAERRNGASIAWERTGDGEFPYAATYRGRRLLIHVNDFPAEPLYTLLSDREAIENLDDWPAARIKPARQEPSEANQSA